MSISVGVIWGALVSSFLTHFQGELRKLAWAGIPGDLRPMAWQLLLVSTTILGAVMLIQTVRIRATYLFQLCYAQLR